ncbi:MAG: cell division ATP-binding protein FtsE [Candidatus Pacebacteria bacterium]|nr:cell division ATP-binding protein FtsE [Candidatus Paceibacterota bacterium]
MIHLDNIGMRYPEGQEILKDVSLHLKAGSFHYLTGQSGAGKSTLLRILHLSQVPTRGNVTVFGQDLQTLPRNEIPKLRIRIGMVFQDCRLINHLSVFDNVALPLRIKREREDEIKDKVEQLLSWVGLSDHFWSRPQTLSGGEQQRVAIARAVIARPDILLADEPTGNLDEHTARLLMRLFEDLNKNGVTIVLATHSEALMDRFVYPMLRLKSGKLERVIRHEY